MIVNFQLISSSNDHLFLAVRDPGPPSSAAGINAAFIVSVFGGVLLVAFGIYCCYKRCTKQNGKYYIQLISIHVNIGFIIQKRIFKNVSF